MTTALTPSTNAAATTSSQWKKVALAVCLAAAALFASGFIPPADNLERVGWDRWLPKSGYAWVDQGKASKGVRWVPGSTHRTVNNVVALAQEGRWAPVAGYRWLNTERPEAGVVWQAGQRHPHWPRVTSSTTENTWRAEAGYVFSNTSDLSSTQWSPGLEHDSYSNVLAAQQEGTWLPRAGFRFSTPGVLSAAEWVPGTAHPAHANVVAGANPNTWRPAPGFAFANKEPGDFSVVALQDLPSANPADRFMRFGLGVLKMIVGSGMGREQADDGFVSKAVVRPFGKALWEQGAQDAAGALVGR